MKMVVVSVEALLIGLMAAWSCKTVLALSNLPQKENVVVGLADAYYASDKATISTP